MCIKHFLIDEVAALEGLQLDGAVVWSTNIGVKDKLATTTRFRSPEDHMASADLELLWARIEAAIPEVEKICDQASCAQPELGALPHLLPSQIHTIFNVIATKTLVFETWLTQIGKDHAEVLGIGKVSSPTGLSALFGRADPIFSAIAEARGDVLVRTLPQFEARKMVLAPNLLDRVFNIINRTFSAILFQAWRRVGKRPMRFRAPKGKIFILHENEIIEEAWIGLLTSGFETWPLDLPELTAKTSFDVGPDTLECIRSLWEGVCDGIISHKGIEASWSLMHPRISSVLQKIPGATAEMRHWCDGFPEFQESSFEPVALLSNGLYSPMARLLDFVLRERSVPVVSTDHGVGVGIGARHAQRASLVTVTSDYYLTHNCAIAGVYDAMKRRPDQKFVPAGTPITLRRARFPRIQRFLYRRYLGAARQHRVLLYASSLSANNMIQGAGTSTDTAYQRFQKELISCLQAFDGDVFIKPYPAHRYGDPEPIWNIEQTSKVHLAPTGEFRQQRWAADIFILDLCSSTLGWAFGCNKPIIYIDNISNPLAPDARAALANSVFLVDALREGWQADLNKIMNMSLADFQYRWRSMASARREFERHYVTAAHLEPASITSLTTQAAVAASKRATR